MLWDWGAHELWLHHARGRPTHTTNRTCKARLGLNKRSSGNSAASSTTKTRTRSSCGRDSLGARLFRRRRALNSHRDDLFTTKKNKAKCSAVLTLFIVLLALCWWELAELLAITKYKVHVAIKGHEFPYQLPTILDGHTHPVVYVLEHLRAL
jgi:hypothetical protein